MLKYSLFVIVFSIIIYLVYVVYSQTNEDPIRNKCIKWREPLEDVKYFYKTDIVQ